ncbi:MAG: sulfite exporter TauE/SafE family protein [Helicobacter sp.]|uniref:sulfite exporter TauE/SafE family protein n=1 Tax=Helicobacter sp. TaxID=218 RepID=UPI002A91217F|nr:sulfite exporter TauE/SafE family protein [Helicobacter sp.]MDY5949811.1 sulfite exporter TauE/SafE family protein [Helicobacter sp.]
MNFHDYLLLLSAAFFASLSHCVGMCGGIVVGLNMRQFDSSKILQALANILYFFGRMCSYMFIGLCFVFIGKSFGFSQTAKAIIFIVLGILLFITALIITFYPKMLGNVTPSGNYAWYKKAFHNALHSKSIAGFFIIGILNGLLPCHLVYMFAIKAADSLSVWHAMLSMFIFSLGTFLPLFLVGFFSQQLFHSTMRRVFLYIAFIIMSYFAFSNVYKGVQLLQGHNPMHHESHDSMSHEKHNDMQMPSIDSNSHSHHHHENHNDETKNYENTHNHHDMSKAYTQDQ